MRLRSQKLTDLHLLSHQPALSKSGRERKMNVGGLRTMMEVGECLMAVLRRGRSWNACMLAGKNNDSDFSQQVASGVSFPCVTT
jgi:hypothetical protein